MDISLLIEFKVSSEKRFEFMSFAIFIFLTYKSFSYPIKNFSYHPKYISCTALFPLPRVQLS